MRPLVTIMTRTLGRPCLADAAASVAAQTYRPIEWLVVDAAGTGLEAPAAGDAEVRVAGAGEPMLRSRAANFGLRAARGERAIVLDDDDLLAPRCVEQLSDALDANPAARVAYGDVLVEAEHGSFPFVYRFEYSPLQLHLRNLFPPNAALFDLSLVRGDGIAFDERLNWFEDWDLWLQASSRTTFVHVRDVTGTYRLGLSMSGIWDYAHPDADPRIKRDGDAVVARHAARRKSLAHAFDAAKDEARRLARDGQLEGAARAWLAAHVMLPSDEEPVLGYAGIARRAGDLDAARETLRAGLAIAPDSVALSGALVAVLEEQGDAEGARAAREDLLRHQAVARAAKASAARRPAAGPGIAGSDPAPR